MNAQRFLQMPAIDKLLRTVKINEHKHEHEHNFLSSWTMYWKKFLFSSSYFSSLFELIW